MPDHLPPPSSVSSARVVPKKQRRLSAIWIVPIVAALAGAWVAVTRILAEGPTITIVFRSAEGLEAGKTKVHYNGVDVGTITAIRLSDDHQRAVATLQMAPKTESFLVADTRFWVVRARVSGASITGLGTLISGAYIGMEIGGAKEARRTFEALPTPPIVMRDVPGRYFVLKTPDLGSLDVGTPIYFRRLHVGEVISYEFDKQGQSLTVRAFVESPYDQYVTQETRFWHASGIDVSLSATGLTVDTQSLLSILIGGIAFEPPAVGPVSAPAAADTTFTLFANRTQAFKPPVRDPQTYLLVFKQSVRGLAPGAPVEFRGIPIGEVVDIGAEVDAKTFEFSAPITIRLDIQRLGSKIVDLAPDADVNAIRKTLVENLVAHGVRAQLQSGSLLTGGLFVAFDVFPDAPAVAVDWTRQPVELPTMPGEVATLEASVTNILKKVEKMPFKEIGDGLAKAIVDLDGTLTTARGTLANADKLIEPNSMLGVELGNTLQEVSRAARALRVLGDYLERHPEALLRGKSGETTK